MAERPETGDTGNHDSVEGPAPSHMDDSSQQSGLASIREFLAYRPETVSIFVSIVLFILIGYVIGEDFCRLSLSPSLL